MEEDVSTETSIQVAMTVMLYDERRWRIRRSLVLAYKTTDILARKRKLLLSSASLHGVVASYARNTVLRTLV